MIHFDLPKEKSSILKVIGVGGGGGNAINHMFSQDIEGVNFIICNTDAQALQASDIPNKVQLGPCLTQGLGAGANPEIGRQATEESLEEIKKILEVNTKMAFITAGMGGGTGTGGAPIISKICKDLGILTVGIVTTPFAYEGKKRQQQAEAGINTLKQYVDTLLVISNDKLRKQFGALKVREAFEKADNVLATAAKCITDVINSTGQINVDFADVCTVMKNGGVAILGNATAEGENRAQKAIEEALNSPLLNDNDIRGAKWILININSSKEEHEFTMEEVDIIQNYLLEQAGDDTDVILGLGYDNTLGAKLGITLIATGFEHKDPFAKPTPKKEEQKPEEKIVMVLGDMQPEENKVIAPVQTNNSEAPEVAEKEMQVMEEALQPEATHDYLTPKLVEDFPVMEAPIVDLSDIREIAEPEVLHFELNMEVEPQQQDVVQMPGQNIAAEQKEESSISVIHPKELPVTPVLKETDAALIMSVKNDHTAAPATSGGYLSRPANIYSDAKTEVVKPAMPEEKIMPAQLPIINEQDELLDMQMQIIEKEDIADIELLALPNLQEHTNAHEVNEVEEDETAEQQRKAAERLHKLRNLSYNVNAADPNNEFETVPAYIRRKMEVHSNTSQIEDFYSSIEVKVDNKNQAQISTINSFLDGKKPD